MGRRLVTTGLAAAALTAVLLPAAAGSAAAAPARQGTPVAQRGPVQSAPVGHGTPVRSAPVLPSVVQCNYQVTASNVRFRINPNSPAAWGFLQIGDIVTGRPGDTATSGGITFQHGFSGKFGQRGWVAVQFIRRLDPCFEA